MNKSDTLCPQARERSSFRGCGLDVDIYGLSNCVLAVVDICSAMLLLELFCQNTDTTWPSKCSLLFMGTGLVVEEDVDGDGETDEGREVRRCERSSFGAHKYSAFDVLDGCSSQGLSFPRFMISIHLAVPLHARVVFRWALESEVMCLSLCCVL